MEFFSMLYNWLKLKSMLSTLFKVLLLKTFNLLLNSFNITRFVKEFDLKESS